MTLPVIDDDSPPLATDGRYLVAGRQTSNSALPYKDFGGK